MKFSHMLEFYAAIQVFKSSINWHEKMLMIYLMGEGEMVAKQNAYNDLQF